MKKQNKMKYMHTMDGLPATYIKGTQICFASRSKHSSVQPCSTLAQIKTEQKLSDKWRKSQGFDAGSERWAYGWVYVNC